MTAPKANVVIMLFHSLFIGQQRRTHLILLPRRLPFEHWIATQSLR